MNTQDNLVGKLQNTSYNADKVLDNTAAFWFVIAVIGQWFFAYYIAVFYGGTLVEGDLAAWTKRMIHGFVEGDYLGNVFVLLHILLAFVITFGGPIQFIPQLRTKFSAFHRWNGRIYIITALLISVGALYMVWAREAIVGGFFGQVAISGNALLIVIFAIMTIRTAMKHNFIAHRKWALRTFLVVSGVWFFRVGIGLWIFLNNGSAPGSTQDLTGPFDMFLYLANYLLPIFFLELYFLAQEKGNAIGKFGMATALVILTFLTGSGIFMAAQIFWLPNL